MSDMTVYSAMRPNPNAVKVALKQLLDMCTNTFPRFIRAAMYGLAAFALSYALPDDLPAKALAGATLFLAVPKRTMIFADIILGFMVIFALVPPKVLALIGL